MVTNWEAEAKLEEECGHQRQKEREDEWLATVVAAGTEEERRASEISAETCIIYRLGIIRGQFGKWKLTREMDRRLLGKLKINTETCPKYLHLF